MCFTLSVWLLWWLSCFIFNIVVLFALKVFSMFFLFFIVLPQAECFYHILCWNQICRVWYEINTKCRCHKINVIIKIPSSTYLASTIRTCARTKCVTIMFLSPPSSSVIYIDHQLLFSYNCLWISCKFLQYSFKSDSFYIQCMLSVNCEQSPRIENGLNRERWVDKIVYL